MCHLIESRPVSTPENLDFEAKPGGGAVLYIVYYVGIFKQKLQWVSESLLKNAKTAKTFTLPKVEKLFISRSRIHGTFLFYKQLLSVGNSWLKWNVTRIQIQIFEIQISQ